MAKICFLLIKIRILFTLMFSYSKLILLLLFVYLSKIIEAIVEHLNLGVCKGQG